MYRVLLAVLEHVTEGYNRVSHPGNCADAVPLTRYQRSLQSTHPRYIHDNSFETYHTTRCPIIKKTMSVYIDIALLLYSDCVSQPICRSIFSTEKSGTCQGIALR